ncbi:MULTISPECIES: type VI secretion system membrane subunit TssM [unclassified Pseudomonas]|uniref:type VI secretion system membrane subunit TssM n=1 Tax=unclassified Pseudomonas TaxID=196821 RepID=UPI00161697D5|nr:MULTISPECIES: type VI secretion system membrane subunit TssM [unclassified Pseudomonas]MBB6287031.1 type VI secretion system protein ImpL [Pseudomonas sp. SJZ073]MBB6311043.1 type VI secretion system protein ImpL [Pseudomonas sp. JAI120]
MNAFFKGAGTVLRKIWLWSLLLVLSSALLVWFFGPLLAVDDYRFWQGATARLLTICCLFLLWGLAMVVVGARRAARLNQPEHQAHHQRLGLIHDEQRQVRGRFKEALQTLKTSRRYGDRSERWRNTLPWYLLIGHQGSGKTHLLAANGLQFPLDRAESPTPGTTAYCDWYFADDAVLLETAGRYLDQPDRTVDAAGWSTLLGLLRSRRRARPLNGVVVTLSVDTLWGGNEHDLELHARHVHTRLQDIQQTLHVDVPVYLVLTRADCLPGFAEFFDAQQGDGTEDILGGHLVAGKTGTDIAQVREAFEALLQRLGAELIPRLHQERSGERRGRMLDFPRQVARLGDRLGLFVETAFSAPRYQRINGLRGFYLTCANVGDTRSQFVQGLFRRVIFAEADLAGLHTPERRRLHRRQGGLALATALVIGMAGWLWGHSYSFNHQRLVQLQALNMPAPAQPDADESRVLLALLDSRLAATRVFPPVTEVRWVDRAGLYQGQVSRPLLTNAYDESLRHQLLPHVATLLEEQVQASLGERERLLDSLRAYLMLNLRERRDNAWLAAYMAGHWSARYAGDTSMQKRLNEHLGRLLEQPFAAPLNDALVAQARQALRGESLAEVVYRALREQARSLEPLRLADGGVFANLEPPIPGFYTKRYQQYFEKQGPALVNAIAQDNWVLGEGTDLSAVDMRRLLQALEQRYLSEYADAWRQALGRVRLQENDNLRHSAEQLASLISAQSALVRLLQQVRENTRLLPAHDRVEALSQQAGELSAAVSGAMVKPLQGQLLPDTARRALQRRFEPLHQLLDEEQNPGAELTQAFRLLDELHLQLSSLSRESSPEQAAFTLVKQRMEGQQPLLANLRNAAARLPLPLKGWLEDIADHVWRHLLDGTYVYVNQRYQSELYGFYAKAIQRRYPFNAHATSDVALGDFQAFFKPRGAMARFYETYLRPFVSVDGNRYRLRGLDGRSVPISRSLLDQLARAQMIRQGFFTEEQGEWAVRFTLAPYSLDQAVSRAILRVGDQQLEYRHGPIVPMAFHWPGEAPGSRSSLVLERGTERPLGIEKNSGEWSLFRFFDLLQSEPANGRDAHILKADLAGLRANYLLTSQRNPSPFQMAAWRTFRLPEQL